MTEQYETSSRRQSVNGSADLLERVIVLEAQHAARERDMERLAAALEATNAELKRTNGEIHSLREVIATARGGWVVGAWILGGLFALCMTISSMVGAFIHKWLT